MASKKTRRTKNLRKRKTARKLSDKKINKTSPLSNNQKSRIVSTFLEMLTTIKIQHWKTTSFSRHKATDDLHSELTGLVDQFVETLLGKDQSRVEMVERRLAVYDFSSNSDNNSFKNKILEYRKFLMDMNIFFDASTDSDLLNIRDEMLGALDKFLYLLTLK